jgi:putative transposase
MKSTRRPRQSAAQWQRLVRQQVASGLSASAFCKRHDLSYASFIQWRSRLRQGNAPVISGSAVVSEPPLPVESAPFIELTAPQALPGAAECWLIELDLGGGVQLRIAQPR